MELDELLGIDVNDPLQRNARELVRADSELLDALTQMRIGRRLTQAQVGEAMGISQGAVARIESGDRDPHLSTLRRYALAVGAVISHTVEKREEAQARDWIPAAAQAAGRAYGWSPVTSRVMETVDDRLAVSRCD